MNLLAQLRGGLIVSAQAWAGSALDDPHVLAAMAVAAEDNGAAGVRMQGAATLRAARSRVSIPLIGLIKRDYPGFAPYITPTLEDVGAVIAAGADIVAFDATERIRPNGTTVAQLVEAIHTAERLALADCATVNDGIAAKRAGSDIIATTLCGYTEETRGHSLPALDLVGELLALETFVICEGGVHRPDMVRAAFRRGADAVVVGTAITNVDWLVRQFASEAKQGPATRNR